VQVRQDDFGRVDPDVCGEQPRLEFLEQRSVNLPPDEEVGDPRAAAVDARAQAREKVTLLGGTGSGCYGWITVPSVMMI
jgi:hypothetical protein